MPAGSACRRLALAGLVSGAAVVLAVSAPEGTAGEDRPESLAVYFGTYTQRGSRGIYVSRMDLRTGRLSPPELAAESEQPSFLALHPSGRFLYAVNEIAEFRGERAGSVSAFAVDAASGRLSLLDRRSSRGAGPCHLVVHPSGRWLLVANYGGGSAAVLPIREDGRLGDATGFVQHHGSSVNPRRQEAPHAHCVQTDPTGRFAFVADLGLDRVMIYRFDAGQGTLTPNEPPAAAVEPGSGPRHFTFLPRAGGPRFAYVINELASTITAFRYRPRRGALEPVQTVSTLPVGFSGSNSTAEVQAHPSGRFLYGSNRGHDSIAGFRVDPESGRLTPIGHTPTRGRTPRNFGIDPTGRYLLAANQDSDSVVVFRIDPESGALVETGQTITVPMPVCVKFLTASGQPAR